jgi:predicted PurR-regulated permease PerM
MLVAIVAASFFVLESLSSVLLPFAIAWLIAYLMQPLVGFVQHKLRVRVRILSIIISLLLVAGVIYGIVMLVVPSILSELHSLKGITRAFLYEELNNSSIPAPVLGFFTDVMKEYRFESMFDAETLVLGTMDVVKLVFAGFVILLYLIFILIDFERLSESWKPYVPKRWRGVAAKLWMDLVEGMNQYFRGQALVAFLVGVLFSIGFLIIDFPAAIAFGMFIGMLNLVPYLQVVSMVPMAMLAMLKAANTGGDFWMIFFSALVVLAVVQVIQDLLLVPHIMGRRMNLHPAVILLSLSVWGHLLGLLGMIVALPLTTLLLGYIKRYHEIMETTEHSEEGALRRAIDTTTFNHQGGKADGAGVETHNDTIAKK